MRKYISGSTWAFWRWTEVDSGYITRLHIIKTPWFAVDMHWLNKPDPEPYQHDHPVTFLSIILWGRYIERRNRKWVLRKWYNFIRASEQDFHTIVTVKPGTITLCFMGPKVREWGFHTPKGWVHWKAYYLEQRMKKHNALYNIATRGN